MAEVTLVFVPQGLKRGPGIAYSPGTTSAKTARRNVQFLAREFDYQKYDDMVCSKLFLSQEQNNVGVHRALGLHVQQQLLEV